jgi:hypothetical protein
MKQVASPLLDSHLPGATAGLSAVQAGNLSLVTYNTPLAHHQDTKTLRSTLGYYKNHVKKAFKQAAGQPLYAANR